MKFRLHRRISNISNTDWIKNVDRRVVLGLSGVILCLVSIGGLYLSTIPYKYLGGDSVGHIDYAWQVYNGRLPKFKEGTLAPFIPRRNVQFVSQHPPLYYTLIAPTIGYNFSKGHFNRAIFSARFITLLVALLSVVALSWAGWVFGGEKKAQFAVALPALIISIVPFIKISSLIMNDILVLLASVVSMTLSGLIILKGPNTRLIVGLAIVSLIGMSSRATFLATMIPSLFAVLVGTWLHSNKNFRKRLQQSLTAIIVIVVVVLSGIGWFYHRNQTISGNWYRSGPQDWVKAQGREYRPLGSVVSNTRTWTLLADNLYGDSWKFADVYFSKQISNKKLSVIVFVGSVGLAGVWAFRKRRNLNNKEIFVVMMFSFQVALLWIQQIIHATGYGAMNVRYVIPSLLPVGLLMCYGLLSIKKLRGLLVSCVVGLGICLVIINLSWMLVKKDFSLGGVDNVIIKGLNQNGFNGLLLYIVLVAILTGLALITASLWTLAKGENKDIIENIEKLTK
ncbi:MAG TPA: hypothetical protein PKB09_00255 [Candidatus Saccharibacteria bacterium]|nr:hypothetical protein [Candidatus Saccharibacteria bacterium]